MNTLGGSAGHREGEDRKRPQLDFGGSKTRLHSGPAQCCCLQELSLTG
jgi:hypothetical protein